MSLTTSPRQNWTRKSVAKGSAHAIRIELTRETDDDPLRVRCGVAGVERRIQVGIALPEGRGIAVVDAGVAGIIGLVDRIAAAREAIAVREGNRGAGD